MLLFALPLYAIALVYGAAALLPSIYLMRYIYRKDTVEKEPPMLLMSLLIYGVMAAHLHSSGGHRHKDTKFAHGSVYRRLYIGPCLCGGGGGEEEPNLQC